MVAVSPALDVCAAQIGAAHMPAEFVPVPGALGTAVLVHDNCNGPIAVPDRYFAEVLHGYRLHTLVFAALAEDEVMPSSKLAQIELLCLRILQALAWLGEQTAADALPIALVGEGDGSAALMRIAAHRPDRIAAVVSRSGRLDLAGAVLGEVGVPTLLIVGGRDAPLLQLNREALRDLRCPKRLEVVTRATRRFEEVGALEAVAHLTGHWLTTHLHS